MRPGGDGCGEDGAGDGGAAKDARKPGVHESPPFVCRGLGSADAICASHTYRSSFLWDKYLPFSKCQFRWVEMEAAATGIAVSEEASSRSSSSGPPNHAADPLGIEAPHPNAAQVDSDPLAPGASGPVMSSGKHRQRKMAFARGSNCQPDVSGCPTVDNGARHGADRLCPDRCCGSVAVIARHR